MFKLKNIKHIWTTLFGLFLIALTVWYLYYFDEHNIVLVVFLLLFAAAFFFSPDETPKYIKIFLSGIAKKFGASSDDVSSIEKNDTISKKPKEKS